MSEEIRVNYSELKSAHESLDQARSALDELIMSLPEGSSNSEAMKEFKRRAEDLRNLIVRYENLLLADSQNLYKAAESFPRKDSTMARHYREGISRSLYGHS